MASLNSPLTPTYPARIFSLLRVEINGERVEDFPTGIDALNAAKPIYEYLPGFRCDIGGCRSFAELPQAARDYIRYVERAVGCPIRWVSVGAERDACFEMDLSERD